MVSNKVDSERQFEKDSRISAQKMLGRHIVTAALILGLCIILAGVFMNQPLIFSGINVYFLFLIIVVGGYVIYQRFVE